MSKRYLKPLVLTTVFTLSVSAQAMLEHAASAAAGSAAGVAGKQISDGITAVMGKSSSNKESDVESPAPATKRVPGGEHPPGWKQPPSDHREANTTAIVRQSSAPFEISATQRPQPITPAYALSKWQPSGGNNPVATAQTIAQIAPGTSIEELGSRLGVPSVRVVIPGNDGQLLQLIRYRDSAGIVGVVHVVDGQVASVDVK